MWYTAFYFFNSNNLKNKLYRKVFTNFPFLFHLKNKIKEKNNIFIQMNMYSLNRIFKLLHQYDCKNIFIEFTDRDNILGVILYFQKE